MVYFEASEQYSNVFKYYRYVLGLLEKPYQEKRIKPKDRVMFSDVLNFFPINASLVAYLISYVNEVHSGISDDIIEDTLGKLKFWDKIETSREMTSKEKAYQLRNCFEHANYKLGIDESIREETSDGKFIYTIDDFHKVSYFFDNGKIKGEIDYFDFVELFYAYIDMMTRFDINNSISFTLYNAKYGHVNNIRDSAKFRKVISDSGSIDVDASFNPLMTSGIVVKSNNGSGWVVNYDKDKYYEERDLNLLNVPKIRDFIEKKNKNTGANTFTITVRNLTDSEIETLVNGASYFTNDFRSKFNFNDDFQEGLLHNHDVCYDAMDFLFFLSGYVNYGDEDKISIVKLNKSLNETTAMKDKNLIGLSPMLYATMLLSMSSYYLNYLYEVNKKNDTGIFDYMNIDLSDIDIVNSSGDKLIRDKDPLDLFRKKKGLLEKQLDELEKRYVWALGRFQQLNNPRNKQPNKEEVLRSVKEIIDSYNSIKTKLVERISVLESILSECIEVKSFEDSVHFFRHLRNSISHGRFSVDYNKGLKEKNLSKLVFSFYDSDDGENINFRVTMSAQRLFTLMNDLQLSITNQLGSDSRMFKFVTEDAIDEIIDEIMESDEYKNRK